MIVIKTSETNIYTAYYEDRVEIGPNRDGTLGKKGCIFCSQGGSGDFAA